jgi:peptidoglycan/xylan/chitin deacetylase (PgdA/CDA1 family)
MSRETSDMGERRRLAGSSPFPRSGDRAREAERADIVMEVPVLMYHSIGSPARSRRYKRFVVPQRIFVDQLDALLARGMQTITAGQLAAAGRSGRVDDIPERAVVLTFDDSFADFESEALPALVERRMVATVFVPTAFIGRRASWLDDIGEGHRTHLDESELRAVHAAGIECGAHSHSHPQLDRLRSPNHLVDEVVRPRDTLEDVLGDRVTTFAYPFGYHSSAVRRAAADAGYVGAFRVDNVRSRPFDDDLLALPRLTVTRRMDASRLVQAIGRRRTLVSDGYATSKRYGWRWARIVLEPRWLSQRPPPAA